MVTNGNQGGVKVGVRLLCILQLNRTFCIGNRLVGLGTRRRRGSVCGNKGLCEQIAIGARLRVEIVRVN